MPSSRRARAFVRAVLTAVAIVGLTCALGVSAVAAPPRPAAETKLVTYRGYQVSVPSSWPVIELAKQKVCVRFDKSAVYLGTPRYQETCPAHLAGSDAGLLIEPLTTVSAARPGIVRAKAGTAVGAATTGMRQVAVESAGVLVTAAPGAGAVLGTGKVVAGAAPRKLATKVRPMASVVVAPGTANGKGFDQCAAPSQGTMDAWLKSSPYRAVGIYISGVQRACAQPNLTPNWIANQHSRGWKFLPIHLGLQAPCRGFGARMSSTPATARSQGRSAAVEAVGAAANLGIVPGSVLYNDMESYDRGGSCSTAVLSFLAGWTDELHARGYLSGVYSSVSTGIADLVANYSSSAYTRPDHVFFAWWNNAANTDGGSYLPDSYWANHQRVKQYAGDVTETWGGVRMAIDRDFLDTANGAAETVNGDRFDDLLAIGPDNTLRLYPGRSDGALGAASVVGTGWSKAYNRIGVGDSNADGYADVLATSTDGRLHYWHNGRDATFAKLENAGSGWNALEWFALVDLNGDNKADVVARDGGLLYWYRGQGSGTFATRVQVGEGWSNFARFAGGDADGDGDGDLWGTTAAGALWFWKGNGSGGFSAGVNVGKGWDGFGPVNVLDLNGDRRADLVAARSDGKLFRFSGRGDGTVAAADEIGTGWASYRIAAH
ncbi:glycoside hydrolase domain-containing protein [Tenggerimyces flavus]|uniref:Glycoside hydrolase domain-containing protein n=1 Tax=Tenggerimyces flavus TaxID=1708749 RepID=A0ABV7YGQ3_9ACTN|nr:glycoside hydrolase domain-containing protein [Tenggerimyces flavus]MBM7787898.1 hypothetical protein [Tenggerimyces flavus]